MQMPQEDRGSCSCTRRFQFYSDAMWTYARTVICGMFLPIPLYIIQIMLMQTKTWKVFTLCCFFLEQKNHKHIPFLDQQCPRCWIWGCDHVEPCSSSWMRPYNRKYRTISKSRWDSHYMLLKTLENKPTTPDTPKSLNWYECRLAQWCFLRWDWKCYTRNVGGCWTCPLPTPVRKEVNKTCDEEKK